MEDRRSVKLAVIAAFALASLLAAGAPGALAYNNANAHMTINEYAYERFSNQYMPADEYLKSATLEGWTCRGEAWDPVDGGTWHDRLAPVTREKYVWEWLRDAGFSADEPEVDMSLIHFYTPGRTPHYLTDNIDDIPMGPVVNPHIDSYQWAFTDQRNPYCFDNGKRYFAQALAGTSRESTDYGKAWRAVGETMHLISDMTIPAHVRNDAHIPYARLWDPLEYFTNSTDVVFFSAFPASTSLGDYHSAYDGETDIRTLFLDEAEWTNGNFFSCDTVPLYGKTTTTNGEALFPSPSITWTSGFEGYLTYTVDGRTLNGTRQSLAGLIWKTPYLVIDQIVCDDQRSICIPTAIKSSTAVLDAFLPRLRVVLDSVTQDREDPDYYVVKAHVAHIPTLEWPYITSIRNGACISIGKDDYVINLKDNEAGSYDLNVLQITVPAKAGDTIRVFFDLGGYRVNSDTYTITGATPTPAPRSSGTLEQPWLNGHYYQGSVNRYESGGPLHSAQWIENDIRGDDTYEVSYYYSPNVISGVRHLYHHGSDYEEWIKEYDTNGNLVSYRYVDGYGGPWKYVVGTPAPVGSNPAMYE